MPNHVQFGTTTIPADPQSPPARTHTDLGDILVFLVAPFFAVVYVAVVTVLKYVEREQE